jgi:hypothetical protein
MFRHRKNYSQPLTIEGEGESFTFADRAFIRIGPEKVEISVRKD